MPAIITDTFDYDDIVRVLDLDEAFVHHQIDALQPKYWRVVIKTKPQGLKIFAPVMVSGNRGIDYLIYMLSYLKSVRPSSFVAGLYISVCS